MAIEIRETTVSTTETATIVRLHIADAPLDDESASFRLQLLATLPRYKWPYLSQIQREAVVHAHDTLNELAERLLQGQSPRANVRPETL